jgi:hypothetical protein
VLLYFLPTRSAALAHTNFKQLFDQTKTAGKAPTRIRVSGADEAFATPDQTSNNSTSGYVAWRRGRYYGWLGMTGPTSIGDEASNVADLLKLFLHKIPRI